MWQAARLSGARVPYWIDPETGCPAAWAVETYQERRGETSIRVRQSRESHAEHAGTTGATYVLADRKKKY